MQLKGSGWRERAVAASALGVLGSVATAGVVVLGRDGRLLDIPVLALYVTALYLPVALGVWLVVAAGPIRGLRARALPAAAFVMAVLVLWTTGRVVFSENGAHAEGPPGAIPDRAAHRAVVLVAIDGLDWDVLEAGIEAGELPTFADLVRRGARGRLATLVPTLSPAIWTTVATGYAPDRHGIHTFAWTSFRGASLRFGNRVVSFPGQSILLRAAAHFGFTRTRPFSSADRRAPTLWQLASAAGERVAVVHWWASWPASPVNGWIVTDRFFFHRDLMKGIPPDVHGLTYPPELTQELAPFVLAPRDVGVATLAEFVDLPREELEAIRAGVGSGFNAHAIRSELPYWIALDRTYGAVAYHALEEGGPWDFFAVYLRGVDIASHAALEYDPRFDDEVDPDDARRFGRAVRETYRQTDRWLSGLLERAPEDALVLVVSDHGWRKAAKGSSRAHHLDAPPGVLLAVGPTVSPGTVVDAASVEDVAPTLLHALGLPVPDDYRGRVWTEVVGSERAVVREEPWVGGGPAERPEGGSDEVDEELLRRLEALGYLPR